MIPISIVIKGLYSYQEEQIVEFDKLLEGQLFGIFGSVGSGKSSILEAIAFALYGETERMNRNDNRSYNMMNLKSNELWIDFQFKNYDESIYRFTVRGKRHGKDFTKVGTYERSAYKLNGESWEPLELKSAEDVLGLSYVNFRRTIIIPQGKFQEFLQLGDKARTDMLKEIFDLSKYEFFFQTTSLERKNKDAINLLQGQLLQFADIEKSYLDEKELNLKHLKKSLASQQTEFDEKCKEFEKLISVKKQYDQKRMLENALGELLGMEKKVLESEKTLQEYEYCIVHFRDKLNRKEELEASTEQRIKQREATEQQISEGEKSLTLAKQELATLEAEYQRQDEYKDQIADLESCIQMNGLKRQRVQLKNRRESGQKHVESTRAVLEQKKKEYEAVRQKRKYRQSAVPDMMMLSDMRIWYDQKNSLKKNILELTQRSTNEQAESDLLLNKVKDQLSDPLLRGVKMGTTPRYHLDDINALIGSVREEQVLVQGRIDQFRLQTKLGEFTGLLKNGEACMLCGSTSHPEIMEIEDVNMHLKDEEGRLNQLKQQETKLGRFTADLSHYVQVLHRLANTIETVKQKREIEEALLDKHLEQFKWTGFSPDSPQQLEDALKSAKDIQAQIIADEKLEQELEQELVRLQEQSARYEKAVQGFEHDVVKIDSEYEALRKNLRRLKIDDHVNDEDDYLKTKSANLKRTIEDNRTKYEQCVKKRDQLSGDLIGLKERLHFLQNTIQESENKSLLLSQELEDTRKVSSFPDFISIRRVLDQQLNVDSLKKEIIDYRQKVYSFREQLENLEMTLGEKEFDKARYLSLEESIQIDKAKLEEERARYIKEYSLFEREQKDFNKKKDLLASLEHLDKRSINLDLLKKLFKGSGFVNYISRVYLQNLCKEANKRFYKLTNQQLQLEVDTNNNFQVRDFLNNGRLRSIKTLSGGQTFQASLSLALALAESVQQQNKSKQNFFFLDEGFGSLDRESLQTALTTLKTLRKENRVVGVISHVEDLQQEIDVFLVVHKDAVRGSLISGSWI